MIASLGVGSLAKNHACVQLTSPWGSLNNNEYPVHRSGRDDTRSIVQAWVNLALLLNFVYGKIWLMSSKCLFYLSLHLNATGRHDTFMLMGKMLQLGC
jgi:hypothetical protein